MLVTPLWQPLVRKFRTLSLLQDKFCHEWTRLPSPKREPKYIGSVSTRRMQNWQGKELALERPTLTAQQLLAAEESKVQQAMMEEVDEAVMGSCRAEMWSLSFAKLLRCPLYLQIVCDSRSERFAWWMVLSLEPFFFPKRSLRWAMLFSDLLTDHSAKVFLLLRHFQCSRGVKISNFLEEHFGARRFRMPAHQADRHHEINSSMLLLRC